MIRRGGSAVQDLCAFASGSCLSSWLCSYLEGCFGRNAFLRSWLIFSTFIWVFDPAHFLQKVYLFPEKGLAFWGGWLSFVYFHGMFICWWVYWLFVGNDIWSESACNSWFANPFFPWKDLIFLSGSFILSLFIDEFLNFDSFDKEFQYFLKCESIGLFESWNILDLFDHDVLIWFMIWCIDYDSVLSLLSHCFMFGWWKEMQAWKKKNLRFSIAWCLRKLKFHSSDLRPTISVGWVDSYVFPLKSEITERIRFKIYPPLLPPRINTHHQE